MIVMLVLLYELQIWFYKPLMVFVFDIYVLAWLNNFVKYQLEIACSSRFLNTGPEHKSKTFTVQSELYLPSRV